MKSRLDISPERKEQLVVLREKVRELYLAGKQRKFICAELGITTSDYHNQLTWLRRKGLISFAQRERAVVGVMPRPPVQGPRDAATSEGLAHLQQVVQEKARSVLSRMKWLHDHAGPEHEQQVKMAGVWKDLFSNLWPRQVAAAQPIGAGLTIVFNGVNRGPGQVHPVVETTASRVEKEPGA